MLQEVSVEQSNNFAIVSERTSAPTVLTLVLSHIDKQLDDTDWIICKTKAAMINNVDASGKCMFVLTDVVIQLYIVLSSSCDFHITPHQQSCHYSAL